MNYYAGAQAPRFLSADKLKVTLEKSLHKKRKFAYIISGRYLSHQVKARRFVKPAGLQAKGTQSKYDYRIFRRGYGREMLIAITGRRFMWIRDFRLAGEST